MKINIFLTIIISVIIITKSQLYDKNVLKAGACVTLLQKIPNKPKDNKIVTHYLLACFINISEETAEQILKVQNYEQLGIEESHVMKLLDIKLLQKKYTPEEIEEFSLLLNKALEPLRTDGKNNNQEQGDDSYGYDNQYQTTDENNGGLINYIIKLFTSSDSLIFLTILFVIFYYCLQKIRQCFRKSDKDDNSKKSNKKNNKSSKKKKK